MHASKRENSRRPLGAGCRRLVLLDGCSSVPERPVPPAAASVQVQVSPRASHLAIHRLTFSFLLFSSLSSHLAKRLPKFLDLSNSTSDVEQLLVRREQFCGLGPGHHDHCSSSQTICSPQAQVGCL